MIPISDPEFDRLKGYLFDVAGIDIRPEKRYLFTTRLADLLSEQGCTSYADLLAHLEQPAAGSLRQRFLDSMTTNETSFFRDGHPVEVLAQRILADLVGRSGAGPVQTTLRALSVGCSTGEEPYSLAVLLHDFAQRIPDGSVEASVLGVDLSSRALEAAQSARYSERDVAAGVPARFRGYFVPSGDGLTPCREVRERVRFAPVNLSRPFGHLGDFDLIFCRNVAIYFSAPLREHIIERVSSLLTPGGALVLGASESLQPEHYGLAVRTEGRALWYVKE